MRCIGDECSGVPGRRRPRGPGYRVMGSILMIGFSMAFGYAVAPKPADESRMHLSAIAPPFVAVSELTRP